MDMLKNLPPCNWGEGEISELLKNPETGEVDHVKCPHKLVCEYFDYISQEAGEKPPALDAFFHAEERLDNKFFMLSHKLDPDEINKHPLFKFLVN